MQAFLSTIKDFGYVEGENLAITYVESDVSKFAELARELVRRNVQLIYAPNTAAAVAARSATASIPIVFATAHDPVEAGLVKSFAKPGGNVTGMTVFASELPGKRLQLMQELVANLARVAVLRSPLNRQNTPAWNGLAEAARVSNLHIEPFDMSSPQEVDSAFGAIRNSHAQAVLLHDDAFLGTQWSRIAVLAIQAALPSNSTWDAAAEAGVLFSYGPSLVACHRRAAWYVAAILKGANPADLPVEQPTQFELIINRRTADAIHASIPSSFLLRADRIIQ